MNAFSLKNKTVLITGASSGIGKSCAVECGKHGANLILLGRNKERLEETQSQISKEVKTGIIVADITQENLENSIAEKVESVGKISGFIHCAGIEKTLPFKKHSAEIFQEIFDINVISGFEIAKIISQKKYRDDVASFVFIASVAGIVGEIGKTAYSASKGAVISGVRSLAPELARNNIRVNSISPAMINTPILEKMFENIGEEAASEIIKKHPLGIGTAEDVANACVFLLSDAAKWITGSNLVVDGGYSI
ncbi:MAG: SDR family oxidoreductase [Flavobacteriaceae bacterium]|jgi:NAD(P)-dependent dehydrogenase (short-subunit alcohol dehydrogenase family)|nr:SDR family oxidoreductase [Flavobacteriaceae bacterium]